MHRNAINLQCGLGKFGFNSFNTFVTYKLQVLPYCFGISSGKFPGHYLIVKTIIVYVELKLRQFALRFNGTTVLAHFELVKHLRDYVQQKTERQKNSVGQVSSMMAKDMCQHFSTDKCVNNYPLISSSVLFFCFRFQNLHSLDFGGHQFTQEFKGGIV